MEGGARLSGEAFRIGHLKCCPGSVVSCFNHDIALVT